MQIQANSSNVAASVTMGGVTHTQTSGAKQEFIYGSSFLPTSGTASFTTAVFNGRKAQTGGANGIIREISIPGGFLGGDAVVDYRAVDISVDLANVKGVYQTGSTTTNSFVGATGFGSTTTPTDKLEVTGNINLLAAGNKLKIATGSNASIGTATLSSGSVTVNTTAVTANSIIIAVTNTESGTQGMLQVKSGNIVPGTSFIIESSDAGDNSTVNWWIVN